MTSMDEKPQTSLNRLRRALNGIAAPFCCDGAIVPEKPVTLVFPDGASLEVARAKNRSEQEGQSRPLNKAGLGVTWLESPPSSERLSGRAKPAEDSGPPRVAHLHSCEYSPWGNFGNEATDVDLYTYAALHFRIPAWGQGLRGEENSQALAPIKHPTSPRTRKPK